MVGLRTLVSSGFAELPKIKGSRFIAGVYPILTEEQARMFLLAARAKHPKATHHCLAFRCGAVARASDDGEPSGTAGRPILAQLDAASIDNAAAVVVRYYGGRKLGAGGLARAYGAATRAALEAGEFEPRGGNSEGAKGTGDREDDGNSYGWLRVELAHQQAHALRAAVERASQAQARATDAGNDGDGNMVMSGIRIRDIEFGQYATAMLSTPVDSIHDVGNLLRGAFHARCVEPSAAPALASAAATDAEASVDITFDL